MQLTVNAMLTVSTSKTGRRHPMQFTRLEIAVFALAEGQLQVLLARRAEAPDAGKWALPGGVLRIDLDESLDAGVRRIAHERLGTEVPYLRQLIAVGGPRRDPTRTPWALSIVYRALLGSGDLRLAAGKRVEELAWHPAEKAAADRSLAFDHGALIARAIDATRAEVRDLDLPAGFLPESFTLGELQTMCEQTLGQRIDKSSFRRRLADREIVEPVVGEMRTGANRPAQIYRLRRSAPN